MIKRLVCKRCGEEFEHNHISGPTPGLCPVCWLYYAVGEGRKQYMAQYHKTHPRLRKTIVCVVCGTKKEVRDTPDNVTQTCSGKCGWVLRKRRNLEYGIVERKRRIV